MPVIAYGISWDDNVDLSEYELWANGKEPTSAEQPANDSDMVLKEKA